MARKLVNAGKRAPHLGMDEKCPYRIPFSPLILEGFCLQNVPEFKSVHLSGAEKWLKNTGKTKNSMSFATQQWAKRLLAEDLQFKKLLFQLNILTFHRVRELAISKAEKDDITDLLSKGRVLLDQVLDDHLKQMSTFLFLSFVMFKALILYILTYELT